MDITFHATSFLQLNPASGAGGKSDDRPLMEAGRTEGRSNAKDFACEVIVVRWLLEAVAQLRPAAAGLGRSDRPRRERCSCCRLIISDA